MTLGAEPFFFGIVDVEEIVDMRDQFLGYVLRDLVLHELLDVIG
jgi:hypothetical protein